MAWLPLVVTSVVCGGLLWLLGRTLLLGLRTGRMPHSDTTQFADRRTSPLFYWFVTLVFVALFVVIAAVWVEALLRALTGA